MYKQIKNSTSILRIADGAYIPSDNGNIDWKAYLAWKNAGNSPEPAPVEPAQVPASVTMRQARLALLAAGKLDDVEAAINALPEPPKTPALIEWNYSNEVLRHNGFVSQIAPMIGMTPADLDAIFIDAAKL